MRAEDCWKVEYECDEPPASDPAERLDRGELAETDFDGRECMSSDVSVAAAFTSSSASFTRASSVLRTLAGDVVLARPPPRWAVVVPSRCLPFSECGALVRPCVSPAPARAPRPAFAPVLRGVVVAAVAASRATGFGAGTKGGSCGLCIVRARFEGGGCSNDAYKLCAADALVELGGSIAPLRAVGFNIDEDEDDPARPVCASAPPAPCAAEAGLL